jgi:hypothetical protein
MQVCRNGHVITDLLGAFPERARSHCDRCGAETLTRCPTCGQPLPGAVLVPGLVPVGSRSAPAHCAACGAAFPWAHRPAPDADLGAPLGVLDRLLRRLPLVVRQLRTRRGSRTPFTVNDEYDLEDLVRSLLPLHFDDVRLLSRTPAYAAATRTDFLLAGNALSLTVKRRDRGGADEELAVQLQVDAAFYQQQPGCQALVGFVYDPEGLVHEPHRCETAWVAGQPLPVRCVIAS